MKTNIRLSAAAGGRLCGSYCCEHTMIVIDKKLFSFTFKAIDTPDQMLSTTFSCQ